MKISKVFYNKRLFTLIELIVVIVVLGILAAIVVPNISKVQESTKKTAIKSDVNTLQKASDLYAFENGKPPLTNTITLTNPRFLDLSKLKGKYVRDIPKHDGLIYWVDLDGKIWFSSADSPNDVENKNGVVTWNSAEGAVSYNVYKITSNTISTSKGSHYKFVVNIKDNEELKYEEGNPDDTYLVSSIDSKGYESAPVGDDYLGIPFVAGNKSNLYFEGKFDEYVEVGHHEEFNLTEGITVEAWVYPMEKNNYMRSVITKGYHFDSVFQLRLARSRNGSYAVFETGYTTRTDNIPIPDNQWTHLVGYYDGEEIGLYVNGELMSVKPKAEDHIIEGNEEPLIIGGNVMEKKHKKNEEESEVYRPETWHGYLDEVRVWNHARTQEEILKNMDKELSGSEEGLVGYWSFNEAEGDIIYDKTSNGFNGKIVGNLKWKSE